MLASDRRTGETWATNPKAARAALAVYGGCAVYLCYVDEAGCPGALPSATSDIQPVLVIAALFVPQSQLALLTRSFLQIKRHFNPGLAPLNSHWLDLARCEIKGADLRRDLRHAGRNRRRAVNGFLDRVITLLQSSSAQLVARIYIKQPGGRFDGRAVYTSSVQSLCATFQNFLVERDSRGLMIADSRTPALNSMVSHSVFTQKFRATGDAYDRILEMPTFGHSENHVALQITDFLCSAILSPMATSAYCQGHIRNVHVHQRDNDIRERYWLRIKALTYRYSDGKRMRGGLTVHDAIAKRSANDMFE